MLSYDLANKNLQLLVIWDLLAGQISCSAEFSMKNVLKPRGQDFPFRQHILYCPWTA